MKKFLLVFLVVSFSAFMFAQNLSISKGVKQGVDNYKPSGAIVQVHHDGPYANNAVGDAGTTFFGASKLRAEMFDGVIGGSFESVDFYIQDMPTGLTMYVWADTGGTSPGAELLMQPIDLGTITANSWNTVGLTSSISITGDALWIGLEIADATGNAFPLGVDAGPADPDGDYVNDAGTWDHLADFGINTNWNIRANVNTSITVPVIDFETVGNDWGYGLFGQGTMSSFEIVANPDPSGINTSDSVACYIVGADAEGWAGVFSGDFPDLTLDATNAIVTVMVWKDVISDFDLKLEPPNVDQRGNQNTVTGQWELLTFDYSAYIGETVVTLTVLPDHVDTRTAGSVTYYDNITFGPVTAQDIPVTFSVDMTVQVADGNFDPAAGDSVVIRGSFQVEAGDWADWQGEMFAMSDGDTDGIYDLDVIFPDTSDGKSFFFKFVINPAAGDDVWESLPDNRQFTIQAPSTVLDTVFFSNDDGTFVGITNTLNFTADIGGILGVGSGGAFDDTQDSLKVEGLDWDGLGSDVMGNKRLVKDPFNAAIYRTTLSVTSTDIAGEGDSTKWKFKAYPDARFGNGGWETGSDRWHIYQTDGSTIDLPTIVPRIFPLFDTLATDINVTFNVDMSDPVNQYNGEHIDPATLEFVGMRGGADFLGDWSAGGNWTPNDTLLGVMEVLTDMGNNQYQRVVNLPGGTQGGGVYEYKYAMMYPGADTVNGGSSPLDNEGGFGINHNFILIDGPDIVLNNFFGDFTVGVEKLDDLIPARFELEQNYPNPFNPSTKIIYTVPEAGIITLKVYNLLGEQVVELVNEEQSVGKYEATFNADYFSSGIYFYTLTAGDFSATKKMILMK